MWKLRFDEFMGRRREQDLATMPGIGNSFGEIHGHSMILIVQEEQISCVNTDADA